MEERGVPLNHYRQHKAGLLLMCDSCVYHRVLPLEDVIARLDARGLVGEQVGVIEAAKYVTHSCPECGAFNWSTRPAFPSIPGQDGITRAT